ncbi:MAG: hypothetical protein AAGI10_04530 [Pseudomonadota bacterium]
MNQPYSELPKRIPRLALMGEFSAGKSTLANLLLGTPVSPVMATATQLPPIWYRSGIGSALVKRGSGDVPFDFASINQTDMTEVHLIYHRLGARILSVAEVIDFPGTADPNMDLAVWKALIPQLDMVFWCTPAHQAWRQSEAALWEEMPEALKKRSALLVTRMDQVLTETAKARLLHRLRQEVENEFAAVLPVSLTGNPHDPQSKPSGLREAVQTMQRWCVEIDQAGTTSEARPLNLEALSPPPADAVARPVRAIKQGGVTPRRIFPRGLAPAGQSLA